jgi:hypothetical protein
MAGCVHVDIGPGVDFASGVRLYADWIEAAKQAARCISKKGYDSVVVSGRGSPSVHAKLGSFIGTGVTVRTPGDNDTLVELRRFTQGPSRFTHADALQVSGRWHPGRASDTATDQLIFFTTESRKDSYAHDTAELAKLVSSAGVRAAGASPDPDTWISSSIYTINPFKMDEESFERVSAHMETFISKDFINHNGMMRRPSVKRVFIVSSLPLAFSLVIGCCLRPTVAPVGLELYLVDRVGNDYYCAGRL